MSGNCGPSVGASGGTPEQVSASCPSNVDDQGESKCPASGVIIKSQFITFWF